MTLSLPIFYARTAPDSQKSKDAIPIRTSLMSMEHAVTWDTKIQPSILSEPERADRYWSWSLFRSIFPLALYARRRQRCIALTTLAKNESGKAVPAAMSLFIEKYPHLPSSRQEAVFIWFISSAPKGVLANLGVKTTPSLGRILIDNALVASMNMGLEGRIGLHCAKTGGDRLQKFYLNHCKLNHLPKGTPTSLGYASDGRFFYTDENLADLLLQELAPFR
ncbi:hypothetical protein [Nitrosovibrio sp. Nv17]|uniref:hypothetical protein n=1 Tax=Nitrosovibrio sp. Nv17 TaxID=1855339 RepID=UPI001160AD36|nr:hypothetical protein [Nitrosovibrio sp. Nv17]